ncbi:hypothetical protein BKA01_003355 [Pseudonocardia eucalypti]|uniref:hypothetical protein n=1 Tax=Pseudonocardia eucalypti TaxID=648755 RepID=UPI00161B8BC2|nr:hypothetical protein [Pseudonocardia eucalypti]
MPIVLWLSHILDTVLFVGIALAVVFWICIHRYPTRGSLLTFLVLLQMGVVIFLAWGLVLSGRVELRWYFAILILEAICLVGIWRWKRFAALLLIMLLVADAVRGNFVGGNAFGSLRGPGLEDLQALVLGVGWIGLWIAACKRKWSQFT